jgi:hypothetical protein
MADRKLLTAAGITGALAVGGVAGALLGAPALSIAQQSDDTTTTVPNGDTGDTGGDGECRPGRGHFFLGAGLDTAAEALGITEDELRDALQDGQTIAEVASDQGVEVQTVIDALVAAATSRIDEAVADGDITQDEADDLKADLEERMTDLVNRDLPGPGGGFGRRVFAHASLDVAAEALGITEDELRDALQDGQTEVASDQGDEVQTVIDALVAAATARIDDEVAEGDLSQDEADDRKADLEERMTDLVNGDLPTPGPFGRHGPGFDGDAGD